MKKYLVGLFVCMCVVQVASAQSGSEPQAGAQQTTSAPSEADAAAGSGHGIIPSEGELSKRLVDGTVELNDIPHLFLYWIDWVPTIAGSIAVLMLVYGGFLFMLSGITEGKEEAKNTIKWALVGIIVSSLAWVIVNLLQVALTR